MFKSLSKQAEQTIDVVINGQAKQVSANISVAAAVLGHNLPYTRTTAVTGSERAPFCMMGVCYDCLMVINGIANQRACATQVSPGMQIETQYKTGPQLITGEPAGE